MNNAEVGLLPDAGWKTEVATSITALASQLAGVVADSGAVATLSSLSIPQLDTMQKYGCHLAMADH